MAASPRRARVLLPGTQQLCSPPPMALATLPWHAAPSPTSCNLHGRPCFLLHAAAGSLSSLRAVAPWADLGEVRVHGDAAAPFLHGQPPLCCCRAPAPASSHGAEDSLRASTSPISSTPVRRPAASMRSAAAPFPPHLPHQTAPAASRRRPWPSPLPPWPPSSLSRVPRKF
ncbi:uncharacterized protein [Zea mays]|uniref:uncharacterized protein n=1 Tax=Zea mays TaxID=4577 RepID=UPI0002210D5B|nr:uncharacterized protein LOC109942448 [Zea mays]|eukprot:XP_020400063.1 uncharacterized protein LOC109942448 [Zea mays]